MTDRIRGVGLAANRLRPNRLDVRMWHWHTVDRRDVCEHSAVRSASVRQFKVVRDRFTFLLNLLHWY